MNEQLLRDVITGLGGIVAWNENGRTTDQGDGPFKCDPDLRRALKADSLAEAIELAVQDSFPEIASTDWLNTCTKGTCYEFESFCPPHVPAGARRDAATAAVAALTAQGAAVETD